MTQVLLENRWTQVTEQLTDTGARFGLDWPALWSNLPPEQQQNLQKLQQCPAGRHLGHDASGAGV